MESCIILPSYPCKNIYFCVFFLKEWKCIATIKSCNGLNIYCTSITGTNWPPIVIIYCRYVQNWWNCHKYNFHHDFVESSHINWSQPVTRADEMSKQRHSMILCRGWTWTTSEQPPLTLRDGWKTAGGLLSWQKCEHWHNFVTWSLIGAVGAFRYLAVCNLGKRTSSLPGLCLFLLSVSSPACRFYDKRKKGQLCFWSGGREGLEWQCVGGW